MIHKFYCTSVLGSVIISQAWYYGWSDRFLSLAQFLNKMRSGLTFTVDSWSPGPERSLNLLKGFAWEAPCNEPD